MYYSLLHYLNYLQHIKLKNCGNLKLCCKLLHWWWSESTGWSKNNVTKVTRCSSGCVWSFLMKLLSFGCHIGMYDKILHKKLKCLSQKNVRVITEKPVFCSYLRFWSSKMLAYPWTYCYYVARNILKVLSRLLKKPRRYAHFCILINIYT